jgi:diacylglycerol kinase (ATP)
MKTAFIVNPVAGRGKARRVWEVVNRLREQRFPHSVFIETKYAGHAREIAETITDDQFSAVVSVGGDGTIHEILNGIMYKKIALGIIPAGSGNDLARTLEISHDFEVAFHSLSNHKSKVIDVGMVGNRYFINIGGVGFDGEVAAEVNGNMKYLRGTAAYIASVLKTLITFQPIDLRIRIDGAEIKGKFYICAVANGKYYGGGMMLAPEANIEDGQFNVCVLEDPGKFDFIKTFPKVFKGLHVSHPKFKFYQGKEILIEGIKGLDVHADGEVFKLNSAQFTILPKSLEILGISEA